MDPDLGVPARCWIRHEVEKVSHAKAIKVTLTAGKYGAVDRRSEAPGASWWEWRGAHSSHSHIGITGRSGLGCGSHRDGANLRSGDDDENARILIEGFQSH